MLTPRLSGQFKRDVRKSCKRGKNMEKLHVLLDLLLREQSLPPHYRDHPLKGTWEGFRDAHIESNWLLIYRVEGDELQLARVGTHSDVFEE